VIPHEVSTLLQFDDRVCLSTLNKKDAIHEFIKDVENNAAFRKTNNQIIIGNTIIHQFYKFIKNNSNKNKIDINLMSTLRLTKSFCHNNQNIIFTRVDKGHVTVALDKDVYINRIEELLNNNNTYSIVKKKSY